MAKYNSNIAYNSLTGYNTWGKALLCVIKDIAVYSDIIRKTIAATLIKCVACSVSCAEICGRSRNRFTSYAEKTQAKGCIGKFLSRARRIREALQIEGFAIRFRQRARRAGELLICNDFAGILRNRCGVISDTVCLGGIMRNTRNRMRLVADTFACGGLAKRSKGMCKIVKDGLRVSEFISRVMEWVKIIKDGLPLRGLIDTTKVFTRIISDKLSAIDYGSTIARFRYNAKLKYNSLVKYNSVLRVFVAHRQRTRYYDEREAYRDETLRLRDRLAIKKELHTLEGVATRVRGIIAQAINALRYHDALDYVRGKFAIAKDVLGFKEYVIGFHRALLTLLGVALTKLYLPTLAVTKQVIHCRIGGGVGVILDIHRSRDKVFEVSVKDESEHIFPLVDATVYFMVKKSVKDKDEDAVIVKSSNDENDIRMSNPVGGLCEVSIRPDDTKELPVGRYVYEVKVEDRRGMFYTVAIDEFIVKHVVKHG